MFFSSYSEFSRRAKEIFSMKDQFSLSSLRNIFVKALVLFLAVNLVFAAVYPIQSLGKISIYNRLVPGRQRLPYGDDPSSAYNLSLFNLEAMFASHELADRPKADDEFRLVIIGDSATWGFLLGNQDTLAGKLNAAGARLADGRRVRAYNLGYPGMSLTKDLLILSYALRFQPDMILWPVTLESFPRDKQLFPPLVQNNPESVKALISQYGLDNDPSTTQWAESTPFNRTIIGARRQLADWFRLQLYGILWAATGIDQSIPESYTPRQEDLAADPNFHDFRPPQLPESDLAFDVIQAGVNMAGKTPVIIINEPTFISQGENSDIRYNFYYPRWAFDDFRVLIQEQSLTQGWIYTDLWDLVPASEFTNTAIHLSIKGSELYARAVLQTILEVANRL
jgi:hypothetical protein